MQHDLKFGELAFLDPVNAARCLKSRWNPQGIRFAPIDTLAKLSRVEFVKVPDEQWGELGEYSWGQLQFTDDRIPQKIIIRHGGNVPLSRSRFSLAHELGHFIFGDRPAGIGEYLNRNRHSKLFKLLQRKGVDAPLTWQEVVFNEKVDLFAEAVLVDEEQLRSDLQNKYTILDLCREYGVSGWTMACSIVRVQPVACMAFAFSRSGPLGIVRANIPALKSGLLDWGLQQIWQRRHLLEWAEANTALKNNKERYEVLKLDGFFLRKHYIPAPKDHWYFRTLRGANAEMIALFTADIDESTRYRVPGTPFSYHANGGSLRCFIGPAGSGKSQKLTEALEEERIKHGDDKVTAFRFFSEGPNVRSTFDRSGISILPRLDPDVRVVAFDDAHFAQEEFVSVISLLLSHGKTVIVAASNLDFHGKPWPVVQALFPIADAFSPNNGIYRCTSKCEWPAGCSNDAQFSQLVGKYPDDVYHIITEKDSFHPVCSAHFRPFPISQAEWVEMLGLNAPVREALDLNRVSANPVQQPLFFAVK